jgi:hypothetical protein
MLGVKYFELQTFRQLPDGNDLNLDASGAEKVIF